MKQPITSMATGILSWLKRQGFSVENSPTSSAEVKNEWSYTPTPPIPVVVPSKKLVCGRSLAGVTGSNPGRGIDICFL